METIFITGTDTNIGKTYVSRLLLEKYNSQGWKTFGIKPIASGCEETASGSLQNSDALTLQQAASIKRPYQQVNPIAFRDPIAPHIAAEKTGVQLTAHRVRKAILASLEPEADINLIEGVGGWSVPLNDHELLSDVISEMNIPVILVIGIKLGCLNHALLTYESILAKGVPFKGWVANCIDPDMLMIEENISTLKKRIKAPCLLKVTNTKNLHTE